MMDPLTIAYYVTGHGLGHATRSLEVWPMADPLININMPSGLAAIFHNYVENRLNTFLARKLRCINNVIYATVIISCDQRLLEISCHGH